MSKMIENYLLKEQIGQGQYGKVFKALDTKTQAYVAIKVMKLNKFREVPKLNEFTNNEIKILTRIENQNVIRFIEILQTTNNVYLVYEYCNGGTLEELIHKSKFLQENQALTIFNQIQHAFSSLVQANILHRDLKPSNILLNDGIIKVADFGFCKSLLGPQDLTKTMVGSPIYMAPEILQGKNYSIKADIWSMGVVLFEMLFGYCPYEDKTIASLINQINYKALKIPTNIQPISQLTDTLLRYMLVVDPKQRIEWNQLLQIQPVIEKQLNPTPQVNVFQHQQSQICQQQSSQPLVGNQILQPIINQQQSAKTTKNNFNQSQEAPKQMIKQYSQNNLNCKAYYNQNSSQQQQQQYQFSQQQTKENYPLQRVQKSISTSNNEVHNQSSQLKISEIIQKNMQVLLKQRQKITSAVNLLKELLSFEGNLNDDLVILIFIKFHVIYWEIKKLTQLISNKQQQKQLLVITELEQKEQFLESKQFKVFKDIFESESEEIEKCLQIYQEETLQYIEQSSEKDLITKFIQFDFKQHEFANKISYSEIISQLVQTLKEIGKIRKVPLNEQKQFLICVNNLINYLGETMDFTTKETIESIQQQQQIEEQSKAIISNLQTLKIKLNLEQTI